MPEMPDFKAEIIIDATGKIKVRNCNEDIMELLYQLNPNSSDMKRRIQRIYNQSARKEK